MDWTAADDIKKDPELDLSLLPDICDDEEQEECDENEENCESQSESSYGSSQIYHETSAAESVTEPADSTDPLCSVTTTPIFTSSPVVSDNTNKMNQYLMAYLPTAAHPSPIQIRADQDMIAPQANCMSISNPAPTIYAEAAQSTTSNQIDNKYALNNQRIITVPVSAGPTNVNYFLMDLAVQMERLNDIAQMELKIEIHRLLLEKLKNVNNMRQAQASICFAAPQNPNWNKVI